MKDQSKPGPQQISWDIEPVEMALQYVHFLAGLFRPLREQAEHSHQLWCDGTWDGCEEAGSAKAQTLAGP